MGVGRTKGFSVKMVSRVLMLRLFVEMVEWVLVRHTGYLNDSNTAQVPTLFESFYRTAQSCMFMNMRSFLLLFFLPGSCVFDESEGRWRGSQPHSCITCHVDGSLVEPGGGGEGNGHVVHFHNLGRGGLPQL